MADDIWTQLAMDMMGASAAIDASNPYKQAASGISALTPIATGALATDPKEALAGIALTQLLSGALGGAGNAWTARRVPEYQQTLRAASQGQPLPQTEYLSPELFKAAQDKGGLFALMNQREGMKKSADIEAELNKTLLSEVVKNPQNAKKIKSALLELSGTSEESPVDESVQTLEQIQELPEGLQKPAIEELGNAGTLDINLAFINDQFEKAKNIKSINALIPTSTASNEMSGIGTSIIGAMEKVRANELSESARKAYMDLMPDWNDTKDQIEAKKSRVLELTRSMVKPTPILEQTGIRSSATPATGPTSAPPPGLTFEQFKAWKHGRQ